MLLSIDRVLQLLAEGKTISKISELATCEVDDVIGVIEEARALLSKYEKQVSRKKIIIKKKNSIPDDTADENEMKVLLSGAELSAVPLSSQLTIYTSAETDHDTGESAIGIIIHDKENRQVGKVTTLIGRHDSKYILFLAIIRAIKIAKYFNTHTLRIRTDSDTGVKQINNEIKTDNPRIKKYRDEIIALSEAFESFHVDSISRALNDKAVFLAQKVLKQHASDK